MALGQYRIRVVPVLDTASLQKQLKGAGANKAGSITGGAYANGFSRAIKERFKYSIANALIYGTEAAFKDMIQNVKELDAAQTELKKVTDLSGKTMDAYTEQAYKAGRATAKTGTEMIQASTQFAKMGKDPQTSLRLAELATRFQNIADTEIDAATAATFINSQLKAFSNTSSLQKFTGDFEKAQHVIDATNEV